MGRTIPQVGKMKTSKIPYAGGVTFFGTSDFHSITGRCAGPTHREGPEAITLGEPGGRVLLAQ